MEGRFYTRVSQLAGRRAAGQNAVRKVSVSSNAVANAPRQPSVDVLGERTQHRGIRPRCEQP